MMNKTKKREQQYKEWQKDLMYFCVNAHIIDSNDQLQPALLDEKCFAMLLKELVVSWINNNHDDYFEYTMGNDIEREYLASLVISLLNNNENVTNNLLATFADHVTDLASNFADENSAELYNEILDTYPRGVI